jgi:hypothetical protein
MNPIYIPSKGRADLKGGTAELLSKEGIDFTIVVEPQDFEAYAERFGASNIETLKYNNRGIAWARNEIKSNSLLKGESWHWQIDDDIRRFIKRVPGKSVEHLCAEPALNYVEGWCSQWSNVGLAGIDQNSWPPGDSEVKLNRMCCQCILIYNELDALWWRDTVEDTDYSLQVLEHGWCTVLFNHLRTVSPPPCKQKGGNTDSGHYERYKEKVGSLVRYWPQMTIAPESSIGFKANGIWRSFKQTLVPY